MRQLRIEYPGAFYHVYNRGVAKSDLFLDEEDFAKFLSLLARYSHDFDFRLHSYCLMSNHYHLFIETRSGNLSRIMRYIGGLYAQYFNTKYDRSGVVFQGRFKDKLVESDSYALTLSRYIHLNPVAAGMVSRPLDWSWSSFPAFINKCKKPLFLETSLVLSHFKKSHSQLKDFESFTLEGLDIYQDLSNLIEEKLILGSDKFIQETKDLHIPEDLDYEILKRRDLSTSNKNLQIKSYLSKRALSDTHRLTLYVYCLKKVSGLTVDQIYKIIDGISKEAIYKRLQVALKSSRLKPERDLINKYFNLKVQG